MSDPMTVPQLVDARASVTPDTVSLRRQLQREQEARRLAEQLAGHGVDEVLNQQRELMLLGRVAVAANEARSLSAAIDECLTLIARHAGWPAATMWVRRPDESHLRPTGSWFSEPGSSWDPLIEAVGSRLAAPTGSMPGLVATSGAPQWFDDLHVRSDWLRGSADHELGVVTALAVPVWAGREVVGVVALFHDAEVARDGRLLELTEQVVTQLGVAVRRLLEAEAPDARGGDGGDLSAQRADGAADSDYGPCPSAQAADDLGAIAHQVRTPLNGLIGNLELLCESGLSSEQRDLGALALQSAIDLHRRLEGWLDKVSDD